MTLSNISKAFVKVIIVFQFLAAQNVLADDWELLISLEGRWKFSIGDDEMWAEPDYEDHKWETSKNNLQERAGNLYFDYFRLVGNMFASNECIQKIE